jgi:NAD(P)-dependent dehydrogenase (short-subunit alcohol dehydrogenase family)
MQVIVITGSTRGIGFGLADSFLALGCAVVISGRTSAAVEKAVADLAARHEAERVFGCLCDVTQFAQVQALWDATAAHFGRVDVWINNAGISSPQASLWEQSPEQIKAVVETNLTGAMYGAKVALKGMIEQGFGGIYNLEGLGSDGRKQAGLLLYGCTKYGLAYLTDALAQEARGTPVVVGAFRPGMVATALITDQYEARPAEWPKVERLFNLLADRVETVTPWLARKALANRKTGARFKWLTTAKLLGRFLAAPFHKRNVFEQGNHSAR